MAVITGNDAYFGGVDSGIGPGSPAGPSLTTGAGESSFAPSATHRLRISTWAAVSLSPFSGISGSGPLTMAIILLLSGIPATNAAPSLPPLLKAAKVVISRPPFFFSGEWQPMQLPVKI